MYEMRPNIIVNATPTHKQQDRLLKANLDLRTLRVLEVDLTSVTQPHLSHTASVSGSLGYKCNYN